MGSFVGGVSPAVLPCLHTLCPSHFNVDKIHITDVHQDISELKFFKSLNNQTLGELFIGKLMCLKKDKSNCLQ